MPTLTDTKVRTMESPDKGRRLIFDEHRDAPRGFGVRITAGGKRAFVLRYTSEGRDRLLTVGAYPTWSLSAARKQASEFRRQIDTGVDILQQRRSAKEDPTVAEAVERFLRTKQGLKSYRDISATLGNHLLPSLGRQKIRSVGKQELILVAEGIAVDHGRTAALLLTYCKQLFSWAEERGLVDLDPAAGIRPGKIGVNLKPKRRDRILSDTEISFLWALEAPPKGMHLATLAALQFILLTGQRPGEVAGMHVAEVHDNLWTIPAERRKNRTAFTVPLSATALALIAKVRRHQAEYVFEARPGRPISPAALARAVARSPADLSMRTENHPWRPHDLRRTMRTGLAAEGIPEHVAELTIGHTRKGIAATYDLHRYDQEKIAALTAWESRLQRIARTSETL